MEKNREVVLSVKHLKQYFRFGRGEIKYNKAVHDVSFDIYKGEAFGLVGESGCGKTTTGRSIIKLNTITSGDIYFKGVRVSAGTRFNEKEIKFTLIRMRKAIEKLKADCQYEISKVVENDSKINQKINQDEYKDTINAIKEKYDALIKEEKDKANKIVAEQKELIKQAKYDTKHCNDQYRHQEIEKVNAELLESYQNAKHKVMHYQGDKNSKEYLRIKGEFDEIKKEYDTKIKLAKNAKLMNKMQMIFQDPIASIDPRMTVKEIIAEGYRIRGIKNDKFINEKVDEVLSLVGLVPEHASRYPHEFSGGQRQRIGIARAIIMEPELIIADEPVSALDVSIQAQVINLLNELKNNKGYTIMFIAHDLSVVKYFCDRIAVMYYGQMVELATSDELFAHPFHKYTRSLLSSIPHPDPNHEKNRVKIHYNPNVEHDYSVDKPSFREIYPGHFVYCNDKEEKEFKKELKKEK